MPVHAAVADRLSDERRVQSAGRRGHPDAMDVAANEGDHAETVVTSAQIHPAPRAPEVDAPGRYHGAALVVVLSTAIAILTPSRANACSCVDPGPTIVEQLAREDVAFIGTVLEAFEPHPDDEMPEHYRYRVRVVRAIKGRVPTLVDVYSSSSCGVRLPVGERVGIVTSAYEGRLHVHACGGTAAPAVLEAIVDGNFPISRSSGSADALVLVDLAGPCVLVLDGHGYVLGQRALSITPSAIDLCPGDVAAVAVSRDGETSVRICTIDVATLTVTSCRTVDLPNGETIGVHDEVACAATDGSRIGVVSTGERERSDQAPHRLVESNGSFQPAAADNRIEPSPELSVDAHGHVFAGTRETGWTSAESGHDVPWWSIDDRTVFPLPLIARNRIAPFTASVQRQWPLDALPSLTRLRADLRESTHQQMLILQPLAVPFRPALSDSPLHGTLPVIGLGAATLAGWLQGRRNRRRS